MARYYNKDELKEKLELEQIFDLLEAWSGEPEYANHGLISQTICHNVPGEGSRKLYYYENTKLFRCWTHETEAFDIFDLCIKVMHNQKHLEWELYDAMDYIASYFGFEGIDQQQGKTELKDWEIFKRHNKIKEQQERKEKIQLKEYNPIILTRLSYPRIGNWEQEGITLEVCRHNYIGYYPVNGQITIPHFDIDNRLIGIRGRSLSKEEADRYGKYRPLLVGKQLYNHPLSMNLYGLNNTKDNIKRMKTAIVFESEKSVLLYESYYGVENNISVAMCGSSLSAYQVQLLRELGVTEIIIGLDRQFQEIGDEEFKRWTTKLIHFYKKYGSFVKITAVYDKDMITSYKASPIDEGTQKFEKLLQERIVPYG